MLSHQHYFLSTRTTGNAEEVKHRFSPKMPTTPHTSRQFPKHLSQQPPLVVARSNLISSYFYLKWKRNRQPPISVPIYRMNGLMPERHRHWPRPRESPNAPMQFSGYGCQFSHRSLRKVRKNAPSLQCRSHRIHTDSLRCQFLGGRLGESYNRPLGC